MNYAPPEFEKKAFTCPNCGVYASFHWIESKEEGWAPNGGRMMKDNNLHTATCLHCNCRLVWFVDQHKSYMLWPVGIANAPPPHVQMPDDVMADYLEARAISPMSPRGAAALLRLAIQRLCKHLGEEGENVNADIGSLVKKGLPVQIQQSLDVVRVTGNNAVHPGELQLDDRTEIVTALFALLNLIVENRIAEPKRIQELYASLPDRALKAIEQRDA